MLTHGYYDTCSQSSPCGEYRTAEDYDAIAARFFARFREADTLDVTNPHRDERTILLRDRLPDWLTRRAPRAVMIVDGAKLKRLAGRTGSVRYWRASSYLEGDCCIAIALWAANATNVVSKDISLPGGSYPSQFAFEVSKVQDTWLTPEE
jgi:hypothetical protein